jgi:hypothetical protein
MMTSQYVFELFLHEKKIYVKCLDFFEVNCVQVYETLDVLSGHFTYHQEKKML